MSLLDALITADTEESYEDRWGYKDWHRVLGWTSFARNRVFQVDGHEFEVLDADLSLNENEGDQSQVFIIFKSRENGEVFKKTGYANSYTDEHYWDGPIVEVRPVEKTITVWEEV